MKAINNNVVRTQIHHASSSYPKLLLFIKTLSDVCYSSMHSTHGMCLSPVQLVVVSRPKEIKLLLLLVSSSDCPSFETPTACRLLGPPLTTPARSGNVGKFTPQTFTIPTFPWDRHTVSLILINNNNQSSA